MTSLGSASLDFQLTTTSALQALTRFGTQAASQLRAAQKAAAITPTVDSKGALREIDKLVKQAQDKLKVNLSVKVQPIKASDVAAATRSATGTVKVDVVVRPLTQKALDAALRSVPGTKSVKVILDDAAIGSKISAIRSQLNTLAASLTGLFKIDASALVTVSSVIGKQIADLTALETRLRALLSNTGGGGRSGTGGGSPGNSALTDYARQLKAIQGDLKSGAASTAQFEASTRAVKTAIDAEITSLRGLGVLTTDQQHRLDALRATSGQAAAALKGVADDATRRAATAQSAAVAQLGRDLTAANSKFEQGTLSTRDYLREIARIKGAAQSLQPSLVAGSRDALNLTRTLQGLGGAGAKINATSITNIRTELARARTAYEQAISAAGSSWRKQQDAATQYQRVLAQLDTKIQQVSRRPTVTPQQTQALANLQRQMASQQNALQGTVSPLGLSGGVLNALRQIPALAQVAGGSLGAAAGAAGSLAGGLGSVTAAIGPIGIAIGAAVLALGSFATLASQSLSAFTEFQDAIQNAKGTLGLFGQEGRAAGDQLAKLAQSPALTKLGFDSVTAAKAIEELGSRGLDTAGILDGGLETAAKLAAASGVKDLNVSAEALVGTMKAFGIEGEAARKIPDLLANAANVSALKLEDFRQAIAAGGSAARTAGFTVNEFTTTISLMRDRLISASDAGTSFKSFTAALTPNSKEAAAAMKAIGFSAFDATGKMKSQRAIVEQLARGLRGMTDQQKQLTLETIFGSDGVRVATTLLDNYNGKTKDGTRLLDARSAALNVQGTADKAAAERTNSLKQAQVQLSNQVLILKQRLGAQLAPAALAAVKGFTSLLDASAHFGQGLKTLSGYLIPAGVALLAFRANVIATATAAAWTSLTGVLTSLPALITAVRVSLQAFVASNPIGLIATVAAGIAIYANKIISDTQAIYDAINQNDQSTNDTLMKRVNQLIKAGDEISKAKARFLLAQDGLINAQAGTVTGATLLGTPIVKVDPAEVKAAQQRLEAAKKELAAAQLRAKTAASGGVDQATVKNTQAAIKAASDAAGQAVIKAVSTNTGVEAADKIVDNCLKWVRLQLDKANPAAADYINKLFQTGGEKFTDKNGKTSLQPTARTAAKNLDSANLLRTFSSARDLTVGDTVFYTSNGQNHSGIYIGKVNGVDTVRGNNRVTSSQTGGARVVGDVPLSKLGTPDSYVKSSELFAAAGKPLGNGPVSAVQAANAEMQKQIDIGKHLQAQLQAALAAGNEVWATKIRDSIIAFKKNNASAWAQASHEANGAAQTTGIALTKLKAALRDATLGRLTELKALYDQTKNASAYNAVVAEQTKRQNAAAASHNTTGIALTKLKAALKDATLSRLAELKVEYDQAKNATAYNAVVAEQTKRQNAAAASHNTTGIALTKLKAALKDATLSRLAELKVEFDQAKNATAYNAVVAEQTKRQNAAAASHNTTGIALTKLKAALKGASDSRLADLKIQYDQAKNSTAFNAVVAEQTKRENAAAAQTKRTLDGRARLIEQIRDHIAAFQRQAQAGKVSADDQAKFNLQMEKFQKQVQKLTPDLQDGTEALFEQARAVSESANGQAKANSAYQTTGITLTKLKEALKGLSIEVLRSKLADAEASGDRSRYAAIQAELTKKLGEQAAASKKAAAEAKKHAAEVKRQEDSATSLGKRIQNLNEDFSSQADQGKTTATSLHEYQQALNKARDDAKLLPPALRENITSLLDQGDALAKTGKAAVDSAAQHAAYAARLKQLKGDVDKLTLSELLNYRAKLVANGADQAKLDILDKQIAQLQQAQVEGEQLLADSQATTQKAATDSVIARYEQRKQVAGQNLAQLLQIEKDFGAGVLAEKNHQARVDADAEKLRVGGQFDAQIQANEKNTELVKQLGIQKTAALAAIDTAYETTALANETASNQARQEAQDRFDEAVLSGDRATRKLLLQQAIQAAGERTAEVENQQADELNVESLTAEQKLGILQKYKPLLEQAKRDEVAAQRKAALDEEAATYAEAQKTAKAQGVGLENVEKDHTARMADITRQYGDGVKKDGQDLTSYLNKLQKDLAAAQTAAHTAETNDQKQHDQAQLAQDRQTRQLQLREALAAAAAKTTQLEGEQADELAAENLTAQQRLDILKKYKPLLEQAKRDETLAQRKAQVDEEDATYADAIQTATDQHLSLENVNKDHANRMAAINRQYGDGQKKEGQDLSSYLLGLTKETNAAQTAVTRQHDQDMQALDRQSRKLLLEESLRAAAEGTTELENRRTEELNAENLTAADRLAILKKYQPLLEQAKREEIAAQRKALLEEEDVTYQEAKKAAEASGSGLELVNRDHTARLAAIERQYGDGAKKDGQDLSTYLLNLTKETNTAQTALNRQHDQVQLARDRQSRKLQLEEALRAAGDHTTQLENDQRAELEAEDVTAQQRLAILKKYQPLLEQAKRDEIAAQRKALVEEETVTYQEAIKTATEQDGDLELVNRDHTARMAAIDRQYGDGAKKEGQDLSTYLLNLDKETNAAQTALNRQHDQAQLALDRQSRKLQLDEALRAAGDRTTELENEQRDALDVEDLTGAERLAIIQKYTPLLEQAKRAEIAAQRKALVEEENVTYQDAIKAADQQSEALELADKDHTARMAAIDRQYGDGVKKEGQDLTDYLAGLQKDLLKARASATKETLSGNKEAADKLIEDALTGLEELNGAQRESLRQMLSGMRDFYAFLGPVGADAVKQLDAAIKKIDDVGQKARSAAQSLVVDPTKATGDFTGKVGRIGAPEDAEDARRNAVEQFAEIRKTYTDGIDEIKLKLKEFEGKPLTLDEAATKLGLEATVRLFTGFVGQIDTKAQDAGDKAAKAFTLAATDAAEQAKVELAKSQREAGLITDAGYQKALSDYATYMHSRVETFKAGTKERSEAEIAAFQADQAASQNNFKKLDADATAALALSKKRGEQISKNGGNGAAVYKAGLQVALNYWQGRLAGLTGTDAQTQAERETIQQTIDDLGQTIENLVNDSPLTAALDKASGAIGRGGQLESIISGGMDGLSAYFKSGGGVKGALDGAAAFVGSLADVFKTGNQDVDNVTSAFVSGLQSTLGALAKGDWIGAAVAGVATVVNTILNIIAGAKRSLAQARQEIADASKDVRIFDVSKYASVQTYKGGFLGLQTLSKSVINQQALDIAKTLGDAISSSVASGIISGIRSGKASASEIGKSVRLSLAEYVVQGLIDGFLKSAAVQAVLQPFLDSYIAAVATGNTDAINASIDALNAGLDGLEGQINTLLTGLVPLSKKLGLYGVDAEKPDLNAGSTPVDTKSVSITGAGSITSTINFDVLGTLSSAVSTYVPIFATAVGDFRGAVGELVALVDSRQRNSSNYVSYRGNRGNLA